MDKESLRKQLAEQMAGFSGEVVRYAAKPLPDRQPWKGSPQNSEKIVRQGSHPTRL